MGCGSSTTAPPPDASQHSLKPAPAEPTPNAPISKAGEPGMAREEPKAPPPKPEEPPPPVIPEPEPEPEAFAAPPPAEPAPPQDETAVVLKEYVPPGSVPKPLSPRESPRTVPAVLSPRDAVASPRAAPPAAPAAAPAAPVHEPALEAMSLSDDEKEPEPAQPEPKPATPPPEPTPAPAPVEAAKPPTRVVSQKDVFGHLDDLTGPAEPSRSASEKKESMFPTLAPRHQPSRSASAADDGFGVPDKQQGLPSIFGGAGKPEPVQLAILALEQKKMREEHEKNMGSLAYMEKLREKNA
eukprot:TRINITY_DN1291_c0_g1_i1.p1 TRINITY_DN1291_c0_g1~~TRINITY_DN1291_c0_g1_i1.p1  ORF type:complete len:297 (+),score=76.55 TRINITY_DN1291_c0_g1_i1:174-1064(+)